ncbi:DNA-directed RNA polymerase I subunit rpa49 [Dispira parvispora]|uniref:DNA-directed RNA polymerase I subunit rpa49 n=1 Tax=Dispira parvispora TaxID=1520584 RepID=A0A9W8E3Y1_9FUNG|nr:DNA-directed RNA polymerase I subunit rpa49 [Dispira parvispora]
MAPKIKSENPTTTADVEVLPTSKQLSIALGSFPGVLPTKEVKFQLFQNTAPKQGAQKVLIGETSHVGFMGANYGKDGPNSVHSKYLVGQYNPVTKKLKVQEAPVFNFTRHVMRLKNETALTDQDKNWYQSSLTLKEEFGTKRTKAYVQGLRNNAVDDSTLHNVKDILSKSIADSQVDMSSVMAQDRADEKDILPPFDLKTTDTTKIYSVEDIIPMVEQQALPYKDVFSCTNPSDRNQFIPFESTFFEEQFKEVVSSGKKNRLKMRMLIYMTYLMKFRALKRSSLAKRGEMRRLLRNSNDVVMEGLLRRYTTFSADKSQSRIVTDLMRKKIICHILILALMVNDYRFVVPTLAYDLGLTQSEVVSYAEYVGCKVERVFSTPNQKANIKLEAEANLPKRSGDIQIAVLKAPLVFTKATRFSKKRK